MIAPRENFRKAVDVKNHWLDVCDSTLFQRAAETALAELVLRMVVSSDPQVAAANAQRIEGAKLFLQIFMGLGEPAAALPPHAGLPVNKLDHTLK